MDMKRVLDGLTRSGIGGGLAGGLAGGLLANAIGGKKARKFAGSALKVGGAAAIGGLAWKAYDSYRNKRAADVAPGGRRADWAGLRQDQFVPEDAHVQESLDILVLRAMIAAAGSDGHIDDRERSLILLRIDKMDMSAHEKAFLINEIQTPMHIDELVAYAQRPDLAAEVYAASLVAVDDSEPAARRYLDELARKLSIPDALVREIHASVTESEVSPNASVRRDNSAAA